MYDYEVPDQRICEFKGCDEKHHAKGWCRTHYLRNWKTGSPSLTVRAARRDTETCTVDGCPDAFYAKGWCQAHYERAKRNDGDPLGGNRAPNGQGATSRRDAPEGHRLCTKCATTKPLDEFHRDQKRPDGVTFYCKACIRDYDEARRERDPERYAATRKTSSRNHRLRTLFGMTRDEYDEKRAAQNGRCKICGKPEKRRRKNGVEIDLSVDHDHVTGIVRDLLCGDCNTGLGHFYDDPVLLRAAADYAERHRATAQASSSVCGSVSRASQP